MSSWLQNEQIAATLKSVLRKKGVSARQISVDLAVPYRSVQNYLSGESRIPADFLLNVCNYIGIEADFFIYESFQPRQREMYDTIFDLADERGWLPSPKRSGADGGIEDWTEVQRIVAVLTVTVLERYDRYRRQWLELRNGGDKMPPGRRRVAREITHELHEEEQ